MTKLTLFCGNSKMFPEYFVRRARILFLFAVLTTLSAFSQQVEIRGKILEESSKSSVVGATVRAKGHTGGTVSDINGDFHLKLKSFPATLLISSTGYKSQSIELYENEPVTIYLEEDVNKLNEVVVVAGGIQRTKREQGYTTTKVTGQELTAGKSTSIAGGLTAKVPGLQVNAISSGVNPSYRLVLRGNRSLTGNNQALIVVDNAIVSSDILNNINPEDIEDIQVLTGASGAALYGSEASNGVLLVTTKKGKPGKPVIKFSHTTTAQQISFFPKLQNKFGAGSTADAQIYKPEENQQYGPAFDGSTRNLGYPLENGDQQTTTYSATNERNKFWNTGIQNQSDLSVSFGDDKSTTYISGQYLDATGTTPGDKYNRTSIRVNGSRKVLSNLDLNYSANYVKNNYDITSATSDVYDLLLNTAANIPVTSYKDWKNNKWATPDGWYNPWYENPYYYVDNFRENTQNTYLTGKIDLKYSPAPWVYFLYRAAISDRFYQDKQHTPKLTYSDYSINTVGKTNLSGSVSDTHQNTSRVNHDFQAGFNKKLNDISLNLILGYSYSGNKLKYTTESASALLIPELYNISNRVGEASVSNYIQEYKNLGIWGDFLAGYKNYLYLHVTGRKDYTSLLKKANRSYFYPSADLSFVVTDAIDALKSSPVLDYLKIRGALSKTGNVNIDPYSTNATFNSVTGYSSGTYFSQSSTLVSDNLKPEITKGWEIGTEFRLFKNVVDAQVNYYSTSTTGQVVSAGVSPSSGYSSYLVNTGEVTNEGIETSLHVTPIRTKDWKLTVGGNFTHNKNLLKTLFDNGSSNDRIAINGSSVIYAQEGYELNQIIVSDYARDDQGRVIVDINTGYPSKASETKIIGNTTPKSRLGVDFSLKYKNFTLTSLFEYRGGYYAAAISLGNNLDFIGSSARSAYYNRERFVFPNSSYLDPTTGKYVANTSITVSDGGTGFWTSAAYNRGIYSNYVYSGAYWKWRELTLTYDLPKSIIKKIQPLQAASISLQGRNLFLWAAKNNEYTDPDYSANDNNAIGVSNLSQTPPSRYFGATISITF